MAFRTKRSAGLKIILVRHQKPSPLEQRSDTIARLAAALNMSCAEDVLACGVDLLTRAVSLAEKHGLENVKIGVPRKMKRVFEEEPTE